MRHTHVSATANGHGRTRIYSVFHIYKTCEQSDMAKSSIAYLILSACVLVNGASSVGLDFCREHDCPGYEHLKDLGNDVELRRYVPSKWVVTDVDETSYEKATTTGFARLFRYLKGHNELEKDIDMTSPVVTTIRLDKDNNFKDDYTVSFFLPYEYQPDGGRIDGEEPDGGDVDRHGRRDVQDPPAPRDDRVHIESLGEVDVYVLPFGSYALGFRVKRLALDFFDYLERNGCNDIDRSSFQVAVYDPPYKPFDRHNEIWVFRTSKKPLPA